MKMWNIKCIAPMRMYVTPPPCWEQKKVVSAWDISSELLLQAIARSWQMAKVKKEVETTIFKVCNLDPWHGTANQSPLTLQLT